MEIYLDHPLHGARVAYNPHEAALLEPQGWVVRKPKVVEPAVVPAADFTDSPPAEAPRKPGRPRGPK